MVGGTTGTGIGIGTETGTVVVVVGGIGRGRETETETGRERERGSVRGRGKDRDREIGTGTGTGIGIGGTIGGDCKGSARARSFRSWRQVRVQWYHSSSRGAGILECTRVFPIKSASKIAALMSRPEGAFLEVGDYNKGVIKR